MNRAGFLNKAKDIVCHDREGQYGRPEDSFGIIAELWTAYLGSDTIDVTPQDVACMMALLKVARIRNSVKHHEDSWVDAIGYMACGGEIDAFAEEYNKAVAVEDYDHDFELVRDGDGKITGLRDLNSGVLVPIEKVGGNHDPD